MVSEGKKGGLVVSVRKNFSSEGGRCTAFDLWFEVLNIILPGATKEEHLIAIFLDLFTWESIKFDFFAFAVGGLALNFELFLLELMGGISKGIVIFESRIWLDIVFEIKLISGGHPYN